MKIDTTLNVGKENVGILKESAELMNITRNELIVKLISRYMSENKNSMILHKSSDYQKRKGKKYYRAVRVGFEEKFYEKCFDIRRFHKLSLSLILFIAIENYLDDIIKGKGVTDNYSSFYFCYFANGSISPIFIITWKRKDKNNQKS